jgi:hypothetical protein
MLASAVSYTPVLVACTATAIYGIDDVRMQSAIVVATSYALDRHQ